MRKTIITIVGMLCLALSATAGDMTWSKYDLNFSVPDGGMITLNTPTHYAQQWSEMTLNIDLFTKADGKDKDVYYNTLLSKAQSYNMYDVEKGKIKVKGFKGYQVEGTMPDGTRCVMVNLVSSKSNLVVQVTVNYLFGNREAVDDLIKSFAENKERKANHDPKRQKIQKPGADSKQQAEKEKQAKPTPEQLQQQRKEKEQELRRKGELRDI